MYYLNIQFGYQNNQLVFRDVAGLWSPRDTVPRILLDINQQNIGMHDYSVMNHSNSVRFILPKSNFPYTIGEDDILQVKGTFQK